MARRKKKQQEQRSHVSVGHPRDPALAALFGPPPVLSGVSVTEDSALSFSAIFAGIRFVADTMASLPAEVYRLDGNGTREQLPNHPLDEIMNAGFNDEMTGIVGREAVEVQKYLHGWGYAEIVRNGVGRPTELHPLATWRVHPDRNELEQLVFHVLPELGGGNVVTLDDSEMFRIPLMTTDGIKSKGLIDRARECIGLAVAAERSAAAFYGNGSRPGGLLVFPNTISEDRREKLRDAWERAHQNAVNSHRVAVLDGGAKWEQIGFSPDESQALETRKFQINEVSRWIGLPPHFLMMLEHGTLANVEQMTLILQKFTMRSLCIRWEQEARKKLFSGSEADLRMQLNMDNLARGDMAARYTAYNIGRQGGWLSKNEIRRWEGMNPLPPAQGDTYLDPMNMHISMEGDPKPESPVSSQPATKGQGATPVQSKNGPPDTPRRSLDAAKLLAANRAVICDAVGRMVRKESKAAQAAAGKPNEFQSWLDEFYGKHRAQLAESLEPSIRSHLIICEDTRTPRELADNLSQTYCKRSYDLLLTAAEGERSGFEERVLSLCQSWENKRADELADELLAEEISNV